MFVLFNVCLHYEDTPKAQNNEGKASQIIMQWLFHLINGGVEYTIDLFLIVKKYNKNKFYFFVDKVVFC